MTDRRIKVLYVDDEPVNLKLLKLTFKSSFDVLTAESGAEGLELLRQSNDIDVIISDMKMPNMNGLEFIENVKSQWSNIPCIILSGYDMTENIKEVLDKNIIVDYFMKPFNKSKLGKCLQDCASNNK